MSNDSSPRTAVAEVIAEALNDLVVKTLPLSLDWRALYICQALGIDGSTSLAGLQRALARDAALEAGLLAEVRAFIALALPKDCPFPSLLARQEHLLASLSDLGRAAGSVPQ